MPGPITPIAWPGSGAPPPICSRSSIRSAGIAIAWAVKSLITSSRSSSRAARVAPIENAQGELVSATRSEVTGVATANTARLTLRPAR